MKRLLSILALALAAQLTGTGCTSYPDLRPDVTKDARYFQELEDEAAAALEGIDKGKPDAPVIILDDDPAQNRRIIATRYAKYRAARMRCQVALGGPQAVTR